MKNQKPLIAAAVVLLLSLLLAPLLSAQGQCGTPIMPKADQLTIKAIPSGREEGVYTFVAMCGTEPCKEGYYLYNWKFGDHDYSVQRTPSRWFSATDLGHVRLVLTGIKESDEPESRYGGCPSEVLRAGGCVNVIRPECPRPTVSASLPLAGLKAVQRGRHEEFGKLLDTERGDFRMVLGIHDGNPVPLQTSQYPLVLQNRTDCPAKVTTIIKGSIKRKGVQLSVVEGGSSTSLKLDGSKIKVESTLPPHSTIVMLVKVHLPKSLGADILGESLEIRAESDFDPTGRDCKKAHAADEIKDLVLRAVDPSYLQLKTRRRLIFGDRVRYTILITNEGMDNPEAITLLHELEPVWDRKSLKYKSIKVDGHRLKKSRVSEETQAGDYFLHDNGYSDSSAVMVIKPTEKHPLKMGSVLELKFRIRLDNAPPAGWEGNAPKGVKLKKNECFVHHGIWTKFDKEGIWYHSESEPPTIVKKGKGLRFWRYFKAGSAVVGLAAGTSAGIYYRRPIEQRCAPVIDWIKTTAQDLYDKVVGN